MITMVMMMMRMILYKVKAYFLLHYGRNIARLTDKMRISTVVKFKKFFHLVLKSRLFHKILPARNIIIAMATKDTSCC
jgi:hypothetical protein